MEALDSNARFSRLQPHEFFSVTMRTETIEFDGRGVLSLELEVHSDTLVAAQRTTRRKQTVARSSRPSRRAPGSRTLPPNVLVVDDIPDVTEVIALVLKHAGYAVATAESAVAALRIAHEKQFDMIISDIGMPEMNGYELAQSLRASANYSGVPIIAVTGYSEYDDRSRALQAGFNAHLTKPIDPGTLLDLMKSLLDSPG